MHLRDDFERMQQTHAHVSRSPSASIPRSSPVGLVPSPYRMVHPGIISSPHGVTLMRHPSGGLVLSPNPHNHPGFSPVRILNPPSPYMLIPGVAPVSASRKRPRDIDDHSLSPAMRRRRERSSSSSSSCSSLGYSSSDQENYSPKHKQAPGKPPSPPKYYSEEFDDINSSDSDYEDDESDVSEVNEIDDLRDFIDFDPKYNKTQISKRKVRDEQFSVTGDQLRDFLFHDAAKPRKWFSAFAWNAVGAKLTKKPASRREPN